MKARITVQVCDLCYGYTQDVIEEGGVEIPSFMFHYGAGGDVLKDVFICNTCTRDEPLSLQQLFERIRELRSGDQS